MSRRFKRIALAVRRRRKLAGVRLAVAPGLAATAR